MFILFITKQIYLLSKKQSNIEFSAKAKLSVHKRYFAYFSMYFTSCILL